jgi:hypothetical protein
MAGKRRTALSAMSQRLTPGEVAQFWFRRGADFGPKIADEYPDFPHPGPDGLFLLEDVRAWFDCWHGKRQRPGTRGSAEDAALEIARHGRRQDQASAR